ncbi:aminoacyl-tRNA hydrolase [Corynebacterium sp. 4HC-13]|uniref:aminoacyl-tRNA hydrolase n=1 Tax=Corynebacterium anserum TaxID=2684406 RepID=UPI00163B0B39|nr:aminoacyl-tRNA hydrolase [Corynebacterium anserum]MBC2682008.1 aminoacyl-tRNA hydrolase [Corynebacterium anserum]
MFLKKILSSFRGKNSAHPTAEHSEPATSNTNPFAGLELAENSSPAVTPDSSVEAPWLIIGLGNPGAKYEPTRHNIGYMAVDRLLDDIADKQAQAAFLVPAEAVDAQVFCSRLDGQPVIIARANSYMNDSGVAIGLLARKFDIPADKIVIVHDELDLPLGQVRIKEGGSENGHNGLRSTTEHLATRNYVRIRMGIGRPPKGTKVIDHVLEPFTEDETDGSLERSVSNAAQAAYLVVTEGVPKAQNIIHSA